MRFITKIYLCIISILVVPQYMWSKASFPNTLSGIVTDSLTSEKLSFVSIYVDGGETGCISNENGYFYLKAYKPIKSIVISCSGYNRKIVSLENSDGSNLDIKLVPSTTVLNELLVHKTKNKYSKKNNPAVDFMQRIRKTYPNYDPRNKEYYSYNLYEKKVLGLSDFKLPDKKTSTGRKMAFLENYMDSVPTSYRPVLKISLREKAAKVLDSKKYGRRTLIEGKRSVGIDEAFNQDNINVILDDIFREIDIFGNDITLITNRFVSPLSDIAGDYYKFYIDTLNVNNEKIVELSFVPHSPESFGMNGRLYVAAGDSTMFIRSLEMRVPASINLNYVKSLYVKQEFEQDSLGNRHKTLDDMTVEIQLIPGTQGFYARRVNNYKDFSYSRQKEHEMCYSSLSNEIELSEDQKVENLWETRRFIPLTQVEKEMGSFLNRMRKVPFLYWTEKILTVLVNGYIGTGKNSKFDFGPVNTLVSYNSTEGVRFRIGGMTTAELSDRFFARGYVAYGLKDRTLKYDGLLEYSFFKKKIHSREFPMNLLSLEHKYDVDMIGQHYLFTNQDNIFLSLKRINSNLTTYRRITELRYQKEYGNNLSFEVSLRNEIQEGTRWLPFVYSNGSFDKSYSQTYLKAGIRWAPGEKFIQQRSLRVNVNMDAPIFMLTHEFSPRHFLGSKFIINRTEISAFKRFWFSAFGYTDIIVKGGIIWNPVPYPALAWQNSNTSYTIQPESYSLINPMEFAMDQYASIDFTYWGNGILFNRIPGVKKLKLREVITFKGLFGKLTDKNNPENNKNLYIFPAETSVRELGKTPYMEIGVGIDNILTFLRVDYVWRLSYRNFDGIDKSGVRVSLHFNF